MVELIHSMVERKLITLYGDVYTVSDTATVNGGADTQDGGDGDDLIYGDVQFVKGSSKVKWR